MKRRFWHRAYLSNEGKKVFGEVFPDGNVPVVSMIPSIAKIEDKEEKIYLLYHEELSEEQLDKLLKMLAEKFDASVSEVRHEMETHRIPLRGKYVNGSGTNHMALFI